MAEEIKNENKPAKSDKQDNKPEKKEKAKLGDRIKKFFKDYKSELKKVVWPTKDQIIKNTSVVLFVIIIMASIIGVLDLFFGFGVSRLTLIKDLFSG
jgi:preprotein translocase subunit SecE